MHSDRRHRGKILFEVLCASLLAASLFVASDQTGAPALLGSAGIVALFALYWTFGLFRRRDAPTVSAAQVLATDAEPAAMSRIARFDKGIQVPPPAEEMLLQEEAIAEPELVAVPEPGPLPEAASNVTTEPQPEPAAIKDAPAPQRARKRRKAKAAVEPAIVEEPAVIEPATTPDEPVENEPTARQSEPATMRQPAAFRPPIEACFDPPPLPHQLRPAFGRKSA